MQGGLRTISLALLDALDTRPRAAAMRRAMRKVAAGARPPRWLFASARWERALGRDFPRHAGAVRAFFLCELQRRQNK
jgi:hypothetical protein